MVAQADVGELRGLRREIDAAVASGEANLADHLLGDLWRQNAGLPVARYVSARYERLADKLRPIPYRLAILRSFAVEPLVPLLRAAAAVQGVRLDITLGGFNTYVQDILDEHSLLYQSDPQAVIVAVQTRDLAPELWDRFADLDAQQVDLLIEQVTAKLGQLVDVFRSRSNAALVLHLLEAPPLPAHGILDSQRQSGQIEAIGRINSRLRALASTAREVYALDYDTLVARHGRLAWHDREKWLTARMPMQAVNLMHLVDEWMRFLHPLTGKVCKALVIDLDNTMWGGVVGEDGISGIRLGPDYPGAFYQDVQRAVLNLYQRGIILAVASKNNAADALEVLENHPGMLLRPRHFAALRINWNDKARSLREIATELNIGLDAVAFLDDNPVERQAVRMQAPEVKVIDLPDDPAAYARVLQESPLFERLSLSDEDRERGRYYADERLRTEQRETASSLEDFYRSLSMELEFAEATPATYTRVAQLTQKTNQFNLTTRRYTEQDIVRMASSTDWSIYTVAARDRYGDTGLVGVVIVRWQSDLAEIDTFLLSCRVMGRTIETAVLATLVEEARSRGAKRLVGCYLPTKKNPVVADFYPTHGFAPVDEHDGETTWSLDPLSGTVAAPPWISRRILTACAVAN